MAEDRLEKERDVVENLGDLIKAREERDSAFADDVDAKEDTDTSGLPADAVGELTRPHPRGRSEEEGAQGINVNLMGTPDEKEVEFDWQDSAEEMLPTDPEASEGMGEDEAIKPLRQVEPGDLAGPVPATGESVEVRPSSTPAEEHEKDGGEESPPPRAPLPIESAMDTDSDEDGITIEEKFEGEVDRETALLEFEEIRRAAEEEEGKA